MPLHKNPYLLFALLAACLPGCQRSVAYDLEIPPIDEGLVKSLQDEKQAASQEKAVESGPTVTEWGNLSGRFVFDGQPPSPTPLVINKDEQVCGRHNLVDESLVVGPDGGLANVVLFVNSRRVQVHPDYEATAADKVTFDNEHCRFEPHILPLRVSQTLILHNSDPLSHNSNITPLGDTSVNPLLAANGAAEHQFKKSQNTPVTVTCSIHPWMKGYVLPRENPYVAVTDEQGRFTIANLPAGELEFQVWQERSGPLVARPEWKKGRFKITIQPGDNDLGDVSVSPALLNL